MSVLAPPSSPVRVPETPRRVGQLVAAVSTVVGSVVALGLLAHVVLATASGQQTDNDAMLAVHGDRRAQETLLSLLGYVSIGSAALVLAVCVVLAWTRHRYSASIGAVTLVAGANLTTQILKRYALEREDHGLLTLNSLPSGHTTVVVSVVLAALLVAPHAIRFAITFVGSVAVTLTGASTVVAQWHRPADVLAALLVSLAWGGLVVLTLGIRQVGPRRTSSTTHAVLSVLGAAIAGLLLIGLGVRPDEGWDQAVDAALVLGGIGLASAFTVVWFTRLSATHSA